MTDSEELLKNITTLLQEFEKRKLDVNVTEYLLFNEIKQSLIELGYWTTVQKKKLGVKDD